ncbi:TetR/AcrR family transcriptional regulator [Pseudomaricurvus alkylphenolicus]|jgi:AcrR family transcriptional regulator|uniref:TetR/AcrR family transcriptional regulator n=1 Tax=Pseudomaricurvus alkylphenolicus TaxID=1306991 RepID=UPI0014242C0A|nr:TetR/AcrR family transcriptional regulator [Pseudomaricurvus alkylphenolicus]NIB38032.1 TetR/AcrR family transcriptional regulator [Pseudomaricurvus alkylphenolicus]
MTKGSKSFARRIGVDTNADFEERKYMVLREAARAFVENGVAKTSIDEIARRLGVTKPTIYHYVGNKENIITECLKQGTRGLDILLNQLESEELSGMDKLRGLLKAYTENVANDFGQCLVAIDVKQLKPESRKAFGKARRRFIDLVQGLIQEGIDDGSIRPQDPVLSAYAIIGAFNFIPQWYFQEEIDTEQLFDGFFDVIGEGLKP